MQNSTQKTLYRTTELPHVQSFKNLHELGHLIVYYKLLLLKISKQNHDLPSTCLERCGIL